MTKKNRKPHLKKRGTIEYAQKQARKQNFDLEQTTHWAVLRSVTLIRMQLSTLGQKRKLPHNTGCGEWGNIGLDMSLLWILPHNYTIVVWATHGRLARPNICSVTATHTSIYLWLTKGLASCTTLHNKVVIRKHLRNWLIFISIFAIKLVLQFQLSVYRKDENSTCKMSAGQSLEDVWLR